MKLTASLSVAALAVAGCYVVPVANKDGSVQYYHYPLVPPPVPYGAPPPAAYGAPPPPMAGAAVVPATPASPIVLSARLYPDNDAAALTGVVAGTVTNMMNGKGRFQLDYRGEILTGEATAVDQSARRGAASASGSNGGYMSCEYQLANARQGAGTCTFSNGARYRLHLGT
jgi:hypothetical protein